ncbi:MAG: PA0069 family radical SAM protein [Chitinophagales bacterium]|nr:PA0069 family radical SAM protein [Chitinophagales bacterium]
MSNQYIKGRGAQINQTHRFAKNTYEYDTIDNDEKEDKKIKTKFIEVFPKTIVNEVKSKDVPLEYSMNPYAGCEHGCSYCYARNTHPFWGYNAGIDFESIILVKKNAAQLLEQKLNSKSWRATSIMLSGNTDCYQPIERKLGITRQMLEVLLKYKNPVGIITKNELILRDIDLLSELAQLSLVHTVISITTTDEVLRRKLEPRTSTYKNRLYAVEQLAKNNIPVMVNIAPIIPGLNDVDILKIAKDVANAGALNINHNILRLPEEVEPVFYDWLQKNCPDRVDKVWNKVKAVHGGQIADTKSGRRMRGEGIFADSIKQQMLIAKKQYFTNRTIPKLRTDLFLNDFNRQQSLF